MKDATLVHSLADTTKVAGKIRFIHSDGKEHCFYFCTNRLSGSRLSWFDCDPPDIDQPLPYIKSVFRDIRKKATVIESIGDF